MKHPLLLLALCATGVICALSGTAVVAFATPAVNQSSEVRGVDPLVVPVDYRPSTFRDSGSSNESHGLVAVPVSEALTLPSSEDAANDAKIGDVSEPVSPSEAGTPQTGSSAAPAGGTSGPAQSSDLGASQQPATAGAPVKADPKPDAAKPAKAADDAAKAANDAAKAADKAAKDAAKAADDAAKAADKAVKDAANLAADALKAVKGAKK